jgi:hypothetical protein
LTEVKSSRQSVFVSDKPAELDVADSFGHADYASAIVNTLADVPVPFTLGLFGDWGVGKTSIIEAVEKSVSKETAFVYFDVWRYEGDALRRQFLRDLATQLKSSGRLKGFDPDRDLADLDVDVVIPEERLAFSVRELLVAAVVALLVGGVAFAFLHLRGLDSDSSKGGVTPDAALSALIAALTFVGTLANRILKVDQRLVTTRRIDEPERFYQKFGEILDATTANRVVIAIDNLDRCSPLLAEQMLSTIKTYLEPLTKEKEHPRTVFVIAVDDAALRRHLVGRELAAGASPGRKVSQVELLHSAELYVDEYLRKFFNGTIRLKALVDEEMRTYVTAQLEQFVAAHGLEQEGDKLVNLVASALRQNPRRVKQFINNLETKLRLIEAREDSDRIASAVSGNVLSIAKLAVIEEEWRPEYAELESDPRLLGTWENEVLAGTTLDERNPALAAFLRTTRDVPVDDIYAILRLRQTEEERTLPDVARFREALALGAVTEASRILDGAPEGRKGDYLAVLPRLFEEEVRKGSVQTARNVLDASLGGTGLPVSTAQTLQLLRLALTHPTLRESLWRLDGSKVFAVIGSLTQTERRLAVAPFVELATIAQDSTDRLGPTISALVGIADSLTDSEVRKIRQSIDSPVVINRREEYLPLAQVRPDVISKSGIDAAWDELTKSGPPIDLQGPESRTVTLAMRAGVGAHLVAPLLDQLANVVASLPGRADVQAQLASLREVLVDLPRVQETEVQALLANLQSVQPSLVATLPQARSTLVELVAMVADLVEDPTDVTKSYLDWAAGTLFETGPELGLDYVEAHTGDLSAALVDDLRRRLHDVLRSTDSDHAIRAGRLLLSLPGEGADDALSQAITDLMDANRLDDACGLLREFSNELSTAPLIEKLFARLEAMDARSRAPVVGSLLKVAPLLQGNVRERLIALLSEMLLSTYEEPIAAAIKVADAFANSVRLGPMYQHLVRGAARHLASAEYDSDEDELTGWVARNAELLDASELGAFANSVRGWVRNDAEARSGISPRLGTLPGLRSEDRVELVSDLLAAEAGEMNEDVRLTLLVAAYELTRGRRGRARDAFDERLARLSESEDPSDERVVKGFSRRTEPANGD